MGDEIKVLLVSALAIFAMVLAVLSITGVHGAPNKVALCHHTQSEANPWVLIEINESGQNGHYDWGTGHFKEGHGQDFFVTEESLCPSTPTPTPTSTPTPTPTPVVPSSPTPTSTATPTTTPGPGATPIVTATPIASPTLTPKPNATPTSTPGSPVLTTPTSTGTSPTRSTSTSESPSDLPSTGGEEPAGGGTDDFDFSLAAQLIGMGLLGLFLGVAVFALVVFGFGSRER